jgi:hypothetical protein
VATKAGRPTKDAQGWEMGKDRRRGRECGRLLGATLTWGWVRATRPPHQAYSSAPYRTSREPSMAAPPLSAVKRT